MHQMRRFWKINEPEPLSPGGFEEKQYETASNLELAEMGQLYPSGQVLEALLGYDVAALPQKSSLIWRFLDMGAPKGALLVPSHWSGFGKAPPHDQLPDRKVSLLLQYKRSQICRSSRAKQWSYWRRFYFRFKIDDEQQFTLENLAQRLNRQAVVRYAAPVFIKYSQLLSYQRKKKVLAQSTFVSPIQLSGHQVWTFIEPGTDGYANAEPKELYAEKFDDVLQDALSRAEPVFLAQHLRSLAGALALPELRNNESPPEWLLGLGREMDQEKRAELRQAILDFVNISDVLGQAGLSWVVFMPDRKE